MSEDIDLTFNGPSMIDLTQKSLRKKLNFIIDGMLHELHTFAVMNGYDLSGSKKDRSFVELGGSSKFVTIKLHYESEITGLPSFIKVQINFLEDVHFPTRTLLLRSIITGIDLPVLERAFPAEVGKYSKAVIFNVYSIEEIFCEKIRAIITRKGFKERDFVDLYMIHDKYGLEIDPLKDHIVVKTVFMLDRYEKYNRNLKAKNDLMNDTREYDWSNEGGLLIKKIPEQMLIKYVRSIEEEIIDIIDEINKRT